VAKGKTLAAAIQTARLGPDGQLSLSPEVRDAAKLSCGDLVVLRVTDEGVLLHAIDPDQAWFWTPEWQEGEREADAEIAAGNVERFDSGEEFLAAMERDLKPLKQP